VLVCANCGQENPEGASFCLRCGQPLVPVGVVAPTRESRKTVTVLFSDVTGSTALGEQLDPESLRRVMGRYFAEMRAVLEAHGGTVEKFIGDAVMAVFGIPVLHEDDALRAVRAASDMRDHLAALNDQLEQDHGVRILVRTGVNTGEVVAGDPDAGQTLVTGDAVNVAARLEQTATPGEILIGETTHRLTRDAVEAEQLEPLALKGKEAAVAAYRLVAVRPGEAGVARRLDSPMVGRDRQLRLMAQAFESATADRACNLFTVLGSAGVGKSRLVQEFLSSVEGAATLRGRCLPYGDGITFWPLREMVLQAADITGDEGPEAARERILALLPGSDDDALIADRLIQVAGLGDSPAPGTTEDLFWAMRKLLESMAQSSPLVAVIDDIHWAEPTLLDLIEHVAEWTRDSPVFLVCIARPELLELRPGWGGGRVNVTTTLLEPLTEQESEELVSNLLGHAQLEESARVRIAEAAEGNPLFVEEMLSMLIDDGLLRRSNGDWVPAGDLSQVRVPPTIRALLAARLDRLEHEERAVIERASVVGKVFYGGAVAQLSPEPIRQKVPGHLMTLVRKELIRRDPSRFAGDESFRFRHILIRDAAYEGMSKETRADLHEAFAQWLAGEMAERTAEFDEVLGYHFEQAFGYRRELGPIGDRDREVARLAADHLARAAGRALARRDLHAAAGLLTRTKDLLPPGAPGRLELLVDLAAALFDMGAFARGEVAITEALEGAKAQGDRAIEWRARIVQEGRQDRTAAWGDTGAIAEEAIRVFEELGDDLGLSRAWVLIAGALWNANQAEQTGIALQKAIDYARRVGATRDVAECLQWMTGVLLWGPTSALEGIARCQDMLKDVGGNRFLEAGILTAMACLQAMQGQADEARASLARGMAYHQDLGTNVLGAMQTAARGSMVADLVGDRAWAEQLARRGYEELTRMGEKGYLSTLVTVVADLVFYRGDDDEALELTRVSEEASAPDDLSSLISWRGVRAKVLARRGQTEEAGTLAGEAIRLGEGTDNLEVRARSTWNLAEVLRMSGRPDAAAEEYRRAMGLWEQKGNLVQVGRCRQRLDEMSG
jgi:class 3 adenylate cyclase/tetratricopeptide (TPR) repeat protein